MQADSTVHTQKPNLTQRVLRIACPFKGHPSRPQTWFKSFEDMRLQETGKQISDEKCVADYWS